MNKEGWLTIFTGPPASGKSIESRRLLADPDEKPFRVIEGHGEKKTIDETYELLAQGLDVVYETTLEVRELPRDLLHVAKTIEIFRRD